VRCPISEVPEVVEAYVRRREAKGALRELFEQIKA